MRSRERYTYDGPAEEEPLEHDAAPDLARVYEAYHDNVLRYVVRLLGRDDAEDVSQEVFLKIGRALPTLSNPGKLSSWIYAITLNAVRDAARRRSSAPDRAAPGTGPAQPDEKADRRRTPEDEAIRGEMLACYLDYVRQLPPRYYEAYVLSEFEHLTNEEIARHLSISVGTAKIRLHRARARLNGELRRNCRCYYNERGELMGTQKGR